MAEGKYGERWIWSGPRCEFRDKLREMIEYAGDLASFDVRLNQETASIVALYDNRAWTQLMDEASTRKRLMTFQPGAAGCDNPDACAEGGCRCDGGF